MPFSNTSPGRSGSKIRNRLADHRLIRLIGRGSYGEVWLAQNLTGALRAVKVVWREAFQDARPYDREFEGIQRFEPVSRRHEGLVEVLHVGKDTEADCFFYIMELADDAATSAPLTADELDARAESYRPQTLREILKARARLPVSECLEIAVRLASALVRLHQQGLVHRDIKPSNVIFVGNHPKLADIGLVTGMDEARSFVGTEGFVPPEGPGTARADIFGFGKLLYEMATGMDRNEFPRLPIGTSSSSTEVLMFAELNEVLVRACDPEPSRRYASAEELRRDLLFLQGGKSVRELRGLERRARAARKVSVAAAAIAVLAGVGYYGSIRQIHRAVKAEATAVANVQTMRLNRVEDLFERDDTSTALAWLARVVREYPSHPVAVPRLLNALTWHDVPLPTSRPMIPKGRLNHATFGPTGDTIWSLTHDGDIQVWDAHSAAEQRSLKLTELRLYSLDFDPTGRYAAIGGTGISVVYDVEKFSPVITLPGGPDPGGQFTAFSPDGQRVFSVGGLSVLAPGGTGKTRVVRVYDFHTGGLLGQTEPHERSIRTIDVAPDGGSFASGSRDGIVRIWEAPTARALTPPLVHGGLVHRVLFSPDSRWLATASDDGAGRIWDVKTGALLHSLVHGDDVVDVAFSPDGTRVATASEDRTARLWDAATGEPIGGPMLHRNFVMTVTFSPDGTRLITGSHDNTARVWDADTALPISDAMRHASEVVRTEVSPDGLQLVSTVSSTTYSGAWLWDMRPGAAHGWPLSSGGASSLACVNDEGAMIAAAGRDGILRIWHATNWVTPAMELAQGTAVSEIAFSANGRLLAAASGGTAGVWDLASRRNVPLEQPHGETIHSVQFSPDGRRLVTASSDATAAIWDAETGRRLSQFPPPRHNGRPPESLREDIFTANFSPDGTQVLTTSRNRTAALWDAETGRKIRDFVHGHWALHGQFSRDGERILTVSVDRSARVWKAADGTLALPLMSHDSDVLMARFSPDEKRIVTASLDWTARVWDATTGAPVSDLMRHRSPVRHVRFSPDGQTVVTGCDDGKVRLWDAASGLPLSSEFQHSGAIHSLEFNPRGNWLLVAAKDGEPVIYEVLQPTARAPKWLPELAEAIAGVRIAEDGKVQRASLEMLFDLRESFRGAASEDFYSRWAEWFLRVEAGRTISPGSAIPTSQFAARLLSDRSLTGLKQSIALNPTNAVAHARFARRLLAELPVNGAQRVRRQALWHANHAARLAPGDSEVEATARDVRESTRMERAR